MKVLQCSICGNVSTAANQETRFSLSEVSYSGSRLYGNVWVWWRMCSAQQGNGEHSIMVRAWIVIAEVQRMCSLTSFAVAICFKSLVLSMWYSGTAEHPDNGKCSAFAWTRLLSAWWTTLCAVGPVPGSSVGKASLALSRTTGWTQGLEAQ